MITRFISADGICALVSARSVFANRPEPRAGRRVGRLVRLLLACVPASLITVPKPAVAQALNRDSVLRILRARHERIASGTARYAVFTSNLDSAGLERWPTGRGRLTAAFESDTLRTVVASYSGARGHATETYYFWNGAPFEVRVRLHDEAVGDSGSSGTSEQHFYFNRGYLVKWIDPRHTIRPLTTGAVFARAMQLMADASRLVDAAHRVRDRTIAPETPAEMAEAMRRELHGLMTAELAYYSENNRYTPDLTTVGYRSGTLVQLALVGATDRGWAARATAVTLPGKSCVVYLGQPHKLPKTAADHARPPTEREVTCDRP